MASSASQTVATLFLLVISSSRVTRGIAPTNSEVTESTVAVKNMLAEKCFAYPVEIFAFPDESGRVGLDSVTFENCDVDSPLGYTVTDIPYGVTTRGKVLSMTVEKGCGKDEENSRTGVFRVTATVGSDSQDIIAIVNPNFEIKPAGPPTYTISSGENVDLAVTYDYPGEISWSRDGLVIQKWKGQLKINVDKAGIYQAFSRKLGRGTRITYRVIERACTDGMYGPDCDMTCATPCYNGVCDDQDGTCICAPGVTGAACDEVQKGFGTVGDLKCEENGVANSGCKGILLCRRDPFGCSCMHGYGGVDCNTKCATEDDYGFNCDQALPPSGDT